MEGAAQFRPGGYLTNEHESEFKAAIAGENRCTCQSCVFWEEAELPSYTQGYTEDDSVEYIYERLGIVAAAEWEGWCKRYPPNTVSPDEEGRYFQPLVDWNDWCGEYQECAKETR